MVKKKVIETEEGPFGDYDEDGMVPFTPHVPSEKERLLVLYQQLKDLGIRSISDLENLIARAE